jgi:hypothetical protein
MTKRPFSYDRARAEKNAEKRRALQNRVRRGDDHPWSDPEAWVARLRSRRPRLAGDDYDVLATLIEILIRRGRQAGWRAAGPIYDGADEIYRAVVERRRAEIGVRRRLPKGRLEELVEEEALRLGASAQTADHALRRLRRGR